MNVVLYTRDMEPITIIDLPMWALELGERIGSVDVAAPVPLRFTPCAENEPINMFFPVARLEFHKLYMSGGKTSWLITVDNDELALTLTPSWLPGQRGKINQYEQRISDLSRVMLRALAALDLRKGRDGS